MLFRLVVLGFCLALSLPGSLWAAEPKEILHSYTDKVLNIFQEIDYSQSNATIARELKEDLQGLAEEIFDFEIISRMSVGHNWKKMNTAQQDRFVYLFKELIQNNYFAKIYKYLDEIKNYSRDNIEIKEQTLFSSKKAEVKTIVTYQDKKIPVNYRFLNLGKGWKVYDVHVEGVSLVQNYRSQFKEILIQKSPEELLQIMQEKVRQGSGEINESAADHMHKLCFFGLCIQAKEMEQEE